MRALHNVTTENVPAGIAGLEVHLNWNTSLVEPVDFTDRFGAAGTAVLTDSSALYALEGFHDGAGNLILCPPYTNATEFAIAARAILQILQRKYL